ncbi:MAG: YihY/virulence factor BrkB family protein [Chloroflexota bacterium]
MKFITDNTKNPKALWNLMKNTATKWSLDQAPRLGAALAYYATFSLAPLLIIAIAISGLVFGREAASGQIVGQIQGLVGQDTASTIQAMIAKSNQPATSILTSLVGLLTLLLGASGVFGELQRSLNEIWGVKPKPKRGLLATLKDKFFSFGIVLGSGFLLLISLVVSAGLAAMSNIFVGLTPGWGVITQIINFIISMAVITVLFALIFKYIPDTKIIWADVWSGAALTALLFTIGKALIGLYIGYSSLASTYGAAASLVVILLWVYYSAQILFFGAEFTQVYANMYGSRSHSESIGKPTISPAASTVGQGASPE